MRRQRIELTLALALLAAPMAAFLLLRANPGLDRAVAVPVQHFYIVSIASLASLALAVLVGAASVRSRQPRTFLMATAFLAIAGIFAGHGLSTPGVLVDHMHHNLVVNARLSLLAGGALFALGAVEPSAALSRLLARHHGALMAGAVAATVVFIAANLLHPSLFDFLPIDSSALQYSTAAIAIASLLFAAWRYYQAHTIARTPAPAALAFGLVLLAESQISMTFGPTWHLSWWEYHALMLVGFLIPIAGFGVEYARGSSLRGVVEGLFLRDTVHKLERHLPEAVSALVAATEAKDPYLDGHARRVCRLAIRMGEHLELPEEQLRTIATAALLHDVGKIGIPDAVLQKPGPLDDEEFVVLKGHATRGYHIVSQLTSLDPSVAAVVKYHHERLDGSGYPDGLRGDAIPLEARVVAVADVWDALTSDRVYRRAWTPDAARALLRQEAGSKLDTRCVDALFQALEEGEERYVERPISGLIRSREAA